MPSYRYTCLTQHGKQLRGRADANSLPELEQQLQQQKLFLIQAKTVRGKARQQIQRQLVTTFFVQFNQLYRAGLPLLECLSELHQVNCQTSLNLVIADIRQAMQQGSSLTQAMNKHPKVFNAVTLALVQVGEESGRLELILGQISQTLKWQDELRSQTKNLLLYPCITGLVVLMVSLFLLLYLVPRMAELLLRMGVDLPLHTQVLVSISNFFLSYGWYVLGGLLLIAAMLPVGQRLPQYSLLRDRFLLSIWVVGPIMHKIILARFAKAFALMYQSGINILSCLQLSQCVIQNQHINQGVQQVFSHVSDGYSLTQGFEQTGLFPSLVTRMLYIGEQSGSLDRALLEIGTFYEQEAHAGIKQCQTLLEPSLTIGLGLFLAWVMSAVLSPMYDIISNVSQL